MGPCALLTVHNNATALRLWKTSETFLSTSRPQARLHKRPSTPFLRSSNAGMASTFVRCSCQILQLMGLSTQIGAGGHAVTHGHHHHIQRRQNSDTDSESQAEENARTVTTTVTTTYNASQQPTSDSRTSLSSTLSGEASGSRSEDAGTVTETSFVFVQPFFTTFTETATYTPTSSSSSSTDVDQQGDGGGLSKGERIGAISGGSIGGALLLGLLIFAWLLWRRRSRGNIRETVPSSEYRPGERPWTSRA